MGEWFLHSYKLGRSMAHTEIFTEDEAREELRMRKTVI